MASFKDINDREWHLELDAPTIRKVRKACDGFDLADLDGKSLLTLQDDTCLLVDVLFVLCSEQAQADGITDIQFGRALKGDALDRATAAMLESIADFFPQQRRVLLRAMADRNARLREAGLATALAKLNDPDLEQRALAAMEQRMDEQIRNALTQLSSATSSPASAGSAPSD